MNVLVTGSSGRIGHYAVQNLQDAGHRVLGVDIVSGQKTGLVVDLTKSGEIYQALARANAEAVVHMGAWANPGVVPDTRTYGENVQGTFNLFQACAELGIKRVISASSAQVYGFAGAPPEFVRVDESHPTRPINCYALSKVAGEQAADYFVKNFGLEILSFRFMGIRSPDELNREIDVLVAHPEKGGALLWTRTDVRDAARACRLAVEADAPASGPYNITGARVLLEMDAG
ncbi:MAG: NAD-dependent epimerase/dehydratase family protein [Candidatus Latescibacterota bacterium]